MTEALEQHDKVIKSIKDKFVVPVAITAERVSDLLCGAFEGGSNYWYHIDSYDLTEGISKDDMAFPYIEAPFLEGCAVIVNGKRLDWKAMENGFKVMGEKYPWHLNNFVNENDDGETSDVFLQCSIFGDIVYG